MKTSDIWAFIGDNVTSLLTVAGGVIAITLEQLGWMPSVPIHSVILGLLVLLATSELIERRRQLSKIQESIEKIDERIKFVPGARVVRFLGRKTGTF